MATEHEGADDLDIRLRWPASTDSPAPSRGRRVAPGAPPGDEATAGAAEPPTPRPRQEEPITMPAPTSLPAPAPAPIVALPTRSPAVLDAIGALAARVDVLGAATTTFRTVLSDRLTDFGEQVDRAQAGAGRNVEDLRRLQERVLGDIQAAIEESERSLSRLDVLTAQLVTKMDDSTELLASLVGRSSETLAQEVARSSASIATALEQQKSQLLGNLGALGETTTAVVASVGDSVERLTSEVQALGGGAVAWRAAVDAANAAGAARSERLGEALDDLGSKVAEFAARPSPVETDLGPVLAQLAALHDAVSEIPLRAVPSPPELATLGNGLARVRDTLAEIAARPQPATVDLTPVIERLDARHEAPPVDLAPLMERLSALDGALSVHAARALGSADVLTPLATLDDKVSALTGRSDRIVEIGMSVERIEAVVEALAESSDDRAELRGVSADIAGLRRSIDDLAAEASRRRIPQADAALGASLAALEETVSRLAVAQAEDLERVLDAVEDNRTDTDIAGPAIGERLARIEATLVRAARAGVSAGGGEMAEQLEALTGQIEAMRRRLSIRARSGNSLDDATIAALADAVAARLRAPSSPDPAPSPSPAARQAPADEPARSRRSRRV